MQKGYQTIATTHSTHISSHASVESFIVLTNDGKPATTGFVPQDLAGLKPEERADLNRFLDATRSTLLFARKVILVEGPSELFLIPVLVKRVLGIDLDRHGVAVVPIFGRHFKVYSKLFGPNAIRKKCVIISDGDQEPVDVSEDLEEDEAIAPFSVDVIENEFVQVYECSVTFERALVNPGTVPMLLAAAKECGYEEAIATLETAVMTIASGDQDTIRGTLPEIRDLSLAMAKRCGKGRFAQIASKHANEATALPAYIADAVKWLLAQ
jgi:putative ATP-dependent endonuclease of OLD family